MRARRPHRARAGDGGFGLIELIVSLGIFSILVGGLTVTMGVGLQLARSNRNRTVAANLGGKEIDAVRQTDFANLTIGLTTSTTSVDGSTYTINRNTEWVSNATTTGSCDSDSGAPKVLRVSVDVSWANMKTVAPYQTSTVLSPPVGAYDPGSGHVAVKVHDRNGAPIAGVPVQVVGGTVNESLTTTDAYSTSPGCAFFGYLPAGTYTVRLGTAGYVDNQGNASPTQSVGVNAGQIASVAFDYDLAGTLDLDLVGINGGTPATTMAVTLANNGYVPSGLKAFSGTGSSRVLGDLFPFPSGYAAFAGDCADADPEGQASMTGPAYWPGASRPDPFEIDPGAATTGTVPLATVQLNFSRTSGSTNLTINAVHAADWKCNGGETLPVASVTTSTSTLVALPYGTWTLKINGKSPVGSWPVVMLDPRSTTTVPANVSI